MTAELTHKWVLNIALPIVLSNATVPILGAVDTGVVGQLGLAAPIGAVGIGAIILSGIYWVFGFLRMGTVGLASQAYGEGNTAEVSALLSRAMLIGVTAGLVLILIQWPLFWGAFKIAPASAEVETLARQYLQIRIFSAPAAIALFGITGWLVAVERTRSVFLLQIAMNGFNICLSVLFVLYWDFGVRGVAWATFIAEWSALIFGLWLCRSVLAEPAWKTAHIVFDKVQLWRMGLVNRDILIRSVCLQAVFMSFLFYGAAFGDVTLAANQILLQFLYITAHALDGFATAAETLVGQAKGRRSSAQLRRAAWMTSLWGLGISFVTTLVFWMAGPALIDLLTTAPDVRVEARLYLLFMVAAPLIGLASWMLDGIFIGATRTKDMRNMMVLSAAIYFAAVYPLMVILENYGLWWALLLSFVLRGITLGLRYPALERAASDR